MSVDDYDYELPEALIARHPVAQRDHSRLLALPRAGERHELRFSDIGRLLRAGDVLVVNDSRVLPARLRTRKSTGGQVELLCVERLLEGGWSAMAKGAKGLRPNMELWVEGEAAAIIVEAVHEGGFVRVRLPDAGFLQRCGELPLPPYMGRGAEAEDQERYQTVYARAEGSVAAPTAGLHFTPELLFSLEGAGVELRRLTLHVGPGTFLPIKTDDPEKHRMHAERFMLPEDTAAAVELAHREGRRVVAVGTTSTRVLESFTGPLRAGPGSTELFIRPGHSWRHVDALVTNFHLPRSTLLMLVCSFAGRDLVLSAYRAAVEARFRFYSYGDAMFMERPV
ncbi:MAG: tRNA preQ1(34) S-adenosylmethionine ribosyltransferase-isomerase QueA [Myxococcota bacterium]